MSTILLPAIRRETVNLFGYWMAGHVTTGTLTSLPYGLPLSSSLYRLNPSDIGLAPGDVISASADIMNETPGNLIGVRLSFFQSDGTPISGQTGSLLDSQTFVRGTVNGVTIPAGTGLVQLTLQNANGDTCHIRNGMINRGSRALPYEVPKRGAWAPIVHGGVFRDDNQVPLDFFSGASQLTSYPGRRWLLQFSTPLLRGDERREWSLALDLLADRSNVFRFVPPEYTGPSTGYAGPNPVVNGAGQTGDALICDGVDAEADIVGPGDFLSFEVTTPKGNTNVELHRVKSLAASDSGGNVTIQLTRPMRLSPADNATVQIFAPTGQFRLVNPRAGLDLQLMRRGSVVIEAEEAIYP